MLRVANAIPLKTKLSALMVIPLTGMILFAGTIALDKRNLAAEAKEVDGLTQLSVRIGNLLHETQKERGATALFMSSSGTKFTDELPAQHDATNASGAELLQFIEDNGSTFPESVLSALEPATVALDEIGQWREDAFSLSVEGAEVLRYYTAMNQGYLNAIGAITGEGTIAEITADSTAYLAFLNAKERTGLERAQLSAAFTTDSFAPGQLATVVALISAQASYLEFFRTVGSEEVVGYYDRAQSHPAVAETARLEAIAVENGVGGFSVDSGYWFQTMTSRIDILKDVEQFQADRILDTSAEMADDAQTAFVVSLAVMSLVTLATLMLGVATIVSLVKQLRGVASWANRAAGGETDVGRLPIYRKDVLGALSESCNGLTTMLFDVGEQARHIARGQITADHHIPGQLGQSFDDMVSSLSTLVERMKTASEELSGASNGLSNVSQSMAESAEQTSVEAAAASEAGQEVSTNVATVAAAIEQMNSSIAEVAVSAGEASAEAANAVQVAQNTSDTITKLQESSEQIGAVIKVINSIAEQTNLLALNATIEAARAGESGKGFAVVANEVKELANQTADATEEISTRIEAIQTDMVEAVDANVKVGETIDRISGISVDIARAVEEQSSTTDEIGRSVEEAATGSQEIARSINDVAAAAEETRESTDGTRTSAEQMTQMAVDLDRLVSHYH